MDDTATVKYKHGAPDRVSARVCIFDADDDGWYFTPPATVKGTQVKCEWEHPRNPLPGEAAVGDDRGEFGMPGLGISKSGLSTIKEIQDYQYPDNNPRVKPMPKVTLTDGRMSVDFGENGYDAHGETPEARLIINALIEEFLNLFLQKNAKYKAVQDGYDLGDKGIIPDLNRKLGILVDRLWNGSVEVGEDTDEVINDMIGHLFLMLAKRRLAS